MTYIIGIFGKIGAGKSTFISLLKQYIEAEFLSADLENKELLKDNIYNILLKSYFPECYSGEVLDKTALKDLIFNDKEKNELLKNISHQSIKSRLLRKIENTKFKVVFVEISVYVDNFLDFDELWLISTNTSKQVKRLTLRDNIDEQTAYNRINFQYIPNENIFSEIIINDGSLQNLSNRAKELADRVRVSLGICD